MNRLRKELKSLHWMPMKDSYKQTGFVLLVLTITMTFFVMFDLSVETVMGWLF